jgi:hypothetical protein
MVIYTPDFSLLIETKSFPALITSLMIPWKEAMSTLDKQHYDIRDSTPSHDTAEYRQHSCPIGYDWQPSFYHVYLGLVEF